MANYSAEALAALSDMDLDDVVEEMVMDREPEPGLLQRVKRSALRQYGYLRGRDEEFPRLLQQSCRGGPHHGADAGEGVYRGRRAWRRRVGGRERTGNEVRRRRESRHGAGRGHRGCLGGAGRVSHDGHHRGRMRGRANGEPS